MVSCALCALPARDGALCDGHRKALDASALTPEQLAGRRGHGRAWLVDPFGVAWAVGGRTRLGRATDSDLAVLHPSVSLRHAELTHGDGGWTVRDLASRNGTTVDDAAVTSAPVRHGQQLRLGDVGLWFIDREPPAVAMARGPGRTAPRSRARLAFTATFAAAGAEPVVLAQRALGGQVRQGAHQAELGRHEFALLRLLADARRAAGDADDAYVPWTELAAHVAFQSRGADSDNVRELVGRLRRKLEQHGLPQLIESRQRRGYRLALAPVEA